jgi:hypothetical protein
MPVLAYLQLPNHALRRHFAKRELPPCCVLPFNIPLRQTVLHLAGKAQVKAKLSLSLIRHEAMKSYEGTEQRISTSALDGGEPSASHTARFNPGKIGRRNY